MQEHSTCSGGGPNVARYGARHISARRIPSPSPASVAARSARSIPACALHPLATPKFFGVLRHCSQEDASAAFCCPRRVNVLSSYSIFRSRCAKGRQFCARCERAGRQPPAASSLPGISATRAPVIQSDPMLQSPSLVASTRLCNRV